MANCVNFRQQLREDKGEPCTRLNAQQGIPQTCLQKLLHKKKNND